VLAAADLTTALPLWVEAVAIAAGAVAGALRGVRAGMAISGVVAVAIAAGLGGGIIRDTLLQSGVPVALTTWAFLPIVLAATAVAVLLRPVVDRFSWVVFYGDTLSIGLYSVLGAAKALRYDVPPVGAALIGVLAGTGGTVLTDLFLSEPPALFRPGPLLGVASALGSTVFVIGASITDNRNLWFVVGAGVAIGSRVVSVTTGRGIGPAERYEVVSRYAVRVGPRRRSRTRIRKLRHDDPGAPTQE
jgi:uncharacterized membrane protein YeiH